MKNTKPNIILINCDDLGYGDLGCYGSEKNATPNIDALAENGIRFSDFYMASPVCSASRAAMMTGCYPTRVGFGEKPVLFPGYAEGLSQKETTVATLLKECGYATKIIGKWHCGDQPEFLPTSHGFDEYFGIPFSNDMGRQVGWDGKPPKNPGPPLPLLRNETVIEEQPDQRSITERYTVEATEFIRTNRHGPFFLYLAHMYVHVPLFVPKQFLDRSKNGAYGGAVECIDWSTGVLVQQLKELGLLENTLIIFTSDNGSRARDEGGSNGLCRGTKRTTWEGGQRVPCIMHWPNEIRAPAVVPHIARSVDFLPTLASLAGNNRTIPNKIDGVDISETMINSTVKPGNNSMVYYLGKRLEAVRMDDWKLHFHKDEEEFKALYNLRDDIGESTDVQNEHPDKVRELEAFADQVRQELGDALRGVEGSECRPVGYAKNAKPLTTYRENHPYLIAMYDLPDMPTMAG